MSNASFKMNGVEVFSENAQVVRTGAGFPAGHVIQVVPPQISVESNSLTTSYVNYYETTITLKSGTSNVLILHQFNYYSGNGGFGQEIYRSSSTPVTTSDTVVWNYNSIDANGPLSWYDSAEYGTALTHAMDIISGKSAGDTLYYGFFYKLRSNTAQVPASNTAADGYFSTTLIEIQK
jgi:hypothetical protein